MHISKVTWVPRFVHFSSLVKWNRAVRLLLRPSMWPVAYKQHLSMAGSIIITLWSLKWDKNLQVCCTWCAPSQKTLSSARNTTSNFRKHIGIVHKATKLVVKEPVKEKQSRDSAEDNNGTPGANRQCTLLNKPAISPTKLRSLMSVSTNSQEVIFLKYNTSLPSSAPAEWLFSLGNLVLTPKPV